MKSKFLLVVVSVLLITALAYNKGIAQTNQHFSNTETSLTGTDNKVEVISKFKATKVQKKVIKKVKKYVTPRILGDRKIRSPFLEGKTITIQMHIDADGNIGNFAVVKGILAKLDNRVISLIKEYDKIQSFSTSPIEKPSTIQIKFDVLPKKFYTN